MGLIARNFRYKNKELILPLYKSLVRPHLENAVQLWSQNLRRDRDEIEKIQRRATKMIPDSSPQQESFPESFQRRNHFKNDS